MIKNRLRIIMADQFLKVSNLSRMTDLSYEIVSKIYNDDFTLINLEHVNKICNALGVTLGELFEYRPDRPDKPD